MSGAVNLQSTKNNAIIEPNAYSIFNMQSFGSIQYAVWSATYHTVIEPQSFGAIQYAVWIWSVRVRVGCS